MEDMAGWALSIIDTTGIQEYIFGSNKLKENIGASHLLVQVSEGWLHAALEQTAPGAHNFSPDGTIARKPLKKNGQQQIEIIYSGGGNIVFLSQNEDTAKNVVRALSRVLLQQAPGLEISAAHCVLKSKEAIGGKSGAYNALLQKLSTAKQQRRRSVPQLGLSVTLACRATGLPAVDFDGEGRAVSAEICAKLDAVDNSRLYNANRRLEDKFDEIFKQYAFGLDFDDFGRSRGDSSYIAVIHADGNGMGKRFEEVVEHFSDEAQNRECLDTIYALSQAVEASGREALHDALDQLNQSFKTHGQTELDERMREFTTDLKLKKGSDKAIFPVRPLVFGGDDLTLVCDGRLGLPLAAVYLRAFHTHTAKHFAALPIQDETIKEKLKKPAYACAGVAIVKAHYPFARAYALSKALCDHAKSVVRAEHPEGASAMDWHFAATGINASLGEMRKRQYGVVSPQNGNLTMRPITVDGPGIGQRWREWNSLRALIETLVNEDAWRERHNKVVALRDALRANDVERFLRNYSFDDLLPKLAGGDMNLSTTGWGESGEKNPAKHAQMRSGYFDAIEALEFYLPVEPVKQEQKELAS